MLRNLVMFEVPVEGCAELGANLEVVGVVNEIDGLAWVGLEIIKLVTKPRVERWITADELVAAVVDLSGVAVLGETVLAPLGFGFAKLGKQAPAGAVDPS